MLWTELAEPEVGGEIPLEVEVTDGVVDLPQSLVWLVTEASRGGISSLAREVGWQAPVGVLLEVSLSVGSLQLVIIVS